MHDDLIERLALDLKPTPKTAVARRLLIGLGAGAAVSIVLVIAVLGFRPDMAEAATGMMFWVKFAYTLALAGLAVWAAAAFSRPATRGGGRMAWMALPVALMALLAVWKLIDTPAQSRLAAIMGGSALVCPGRIIAFSLPPLAGLIWAVRGLAPTHLRWAGAMIGLAAGGAGATAYALACDESAAPFLVIWYSLGIAATTAVGALLGPRVLRW
jgi:hypothetical protein